MGNPFIPFPRCENIIIVGDAAAEYLGALRIYGRGLIGGDVPSMELLHPMEKHLECVSCFLNDPTQVLMPAVRRMKADFVVLEENGSADFNPAAGREALEKEGISVKILDVRGSTESVLRRAGKLFGEEKQAERIIRERTERLAALDDVRKSIRKGQKAAIFLAIRSPVRHESYVFRISERSALSQLLTNTFAIENINVRPNAEERIPGIQELDDLSDIFEKNPDLIVYTGDAAACGQKIAEFIRKHPQFAECNAVKNGRIYGAPYYCHALDLRRHEILEAWSDVLAD